MSINTALLIIVQLLFTGFILGPSIVFYRLRKHPYIQNRQVNLVMLIAFCAFWNGCTDISNFKVFASQDRVACWVRIMNQMLSGPVFNFTILLRALVLFETAIVEQLKSNKFADLTGFQLAVVKIFSPTKEKSSGSRPSTSIASKINWSVGAEEAQSRQNMKNRPKLHIKFSNRIPGRILLLIFLIFILLMLCLAAMSFGLYPSNLTGACIPEQATFRIVIQAGIILFTPFLCYLIKDVDDGYNLRNEIELNSWVCLICFAAYTAENYSGFNLIAEIGPYFYVLFMFIFVHCSSVIYPVWVVSCSNKEKAASKVDVDIESNRMEILLEILNSPSKSLKFKMLLRKQFCSENLMYYEKFQQASDSRNDSQKLKAILHEIYINFVALESPLELNLSQKMRDDYLNAINQPGVGIKALDQITAEVLKMMLADSLPQYLRTFK